MTTVEQLLTEIRDALNEDTAIAWPDTMLVRAINEANRDLARSTRHYKDTATIETLANVGEYDVPAEIISIEHLYFDTGDGRKIPLDARHYESMDAVWGQWQNRASTYPEFFTTVGYSPNLKIVLYPTPTAVGELSLITSRLPVELATAPVDPTETADVPTAWYDAIVDYVEAKALRRDRDPRWQEARQLYVEKRDNLINNPDYLGVNREMVPVPGVGYLPGWLTEFDY